MREECLFTFEDNELLVIVCNMQIPDYLVISAGTNSIQHATRQEAITKLLND